METRSKWRSHYTKFFKYDETKNSFNKGEVKQQTHFNIDILIINNSKQKFHTKPELLIYLYTHIYIFIYS